MTGTNHAGEANSVPVIDLQSAGAPAAIDNACRKIGFFALGGHGISVERREALLDAARRLFALPPEVKAAIGLSTGGHAWRGWFPLGDELTSGVPDLKEGFYVGRELPPDPRPLHGPNRWPDEVPELRSLVLDWMDDMERVGQQVLTAMATGLGLDPGWFLDHLTADPTVLLRIFRYPPHPGGLSGDDRWGVAEHSDYGLLTLLAHDGTPGLEVRNGDRFIAAPLDPDLIVCNLGDMLDRLTGGRYRSTAHRVRNVSAHDRISLPFFLDPSWTADVVPLDLDDGWIEPDNAHERWDRADLRAIDGPYGDWLLAKVRRVFPQLAGTLDEAMLTDD